MSPAAAASVRPSVPVAPIVGAPVAGLFTRMTNSWRAAARLRSTAVTATASVPRSPARAVPEKVRPAGSNESQAGRAAPAASVAE